MYVTVDLIGCTVTTISTNELGQLIVMGNSGGNDTDVAGQGQRLKSTRSPVQDLPEMYAGSELPGVPENNKKNWNYGTKYTDRESINMDA